MAKALLRIVEQDEKTLRHVYRKCQGAHWTLTCLALIDYRRTYNENWLIERHGHRAPAQFRRDQMDKIPLAA